MHGGSGDITALTSTKGLLFAACNERHLAIENDVSGLSRMSVFGVERVRRIFPNIGPAEPLGLKLPLQLSFLGTLIHVIFPAEALAQM